MGKVLRHHILSMFRLWCLSLTVSFLATGMALADCPEGQEQAKDINGTAMTDEQGKPMCLPAWTKMNTDASKKPDEEAKGTQSADSDVWTNGAKPYDSYGRDEGGGGVQTTSGGWQDSVTGAAAAVTGGGNSGRPAGNQDVWSTGAAPTNTYGQGGDTQTVSSGWRDAVGQTGTLFPNASHGGDEAATHTGAAQDVWTNGTAGFDSYGREVNTQTTSAGWQDSVTPEALAVHGSGSGFAGAAAGDVWSKGTAGFDSYGQAVNAQTTSAGWQDSAVVPTGLRTPGSGEFSGLTRGIEQKDVWSTGAAPVDNYGGAASNYVGIGDAASASGLAAFTGEQGKGTADGWGAGAGAVENYSGAGSNSPGVQTGLLNNDNGAGMDMDFGGPQKEAEALARGGTPQNFTDEQLKAAENQINRDSIVRMNGNDMARAEDYLKMSQRQGPLTVEEQIDRNVMAKEAGHGQALRDAMYNSDGRLGLNTNNSLGNDDSFFEGYYGMTREKALDLEAKGELSAALEARYNQLNEEAKPLIDQMSMGEFMANKGEYVRSEKMLDPDMLASAENAQAGLPGKMQQNGLSETIKSEFGRRFHPIKRAWLNHKGIDYAVRNTGEVASVAKGRVVEAGWKGGYGNYVKIDHGNGLFTEYGHMSKISVREGQLVDEGSVIGKPGSTGLSTGPHIHFGVIKDGEFVNPATIMNTRTGQLNQDLVAQGLGSANYAQKEYARLYGGEAPTQFAGSANGNSVWNGVPTTAGATTGGATSAVFQGMGTSGQGSGWDNVPLPSTGNSEASPQQASYTKTGTIWDSIPTTMGTGGGGSVASGDPNPDAVATGLSSRTQQDQARLANTTPSVNYDALNKRLGWPTGAAERIAMIESNGDPNSNWNKSTKYKGLFQISASEMRSVGLNDPLDLRQNVEAFARLQERNISSLENSLGRTPSVGEVYLSHQQGRAGSVALLNGGDTPAVETLSQFYGYNKAYQVVYGNLPSSMRSQAATIGSADFAGYWAYNKVDQHLSGATAQVAQVQTYQTGGLTSGRDPWGVQLASVSNMQASVGNSVNYWLDGSVNGLAGTQLASNSPYVGAATRNYYTPDSSYVSSPYGNGYLAAGVPVQTIRLASGESYTLYSDGYGGYTYGNNVNTGGGGMGSAGWAGVGGGTSGGGGYPSGIPSSPAQVNNTPGQPVVQGGGASAPAVDVRGMDLVRMGLTSPEKIEAFCKDSDSDLYKNNKDLAKQVCKAG